MTRQPAELYLGRSGANQREILTPEGIPLRVVVADSGTRATAFLLDCLIILCMIIATAFLFGAAMSAGDSGIVGAVAQLTMFFLTNFYFAFFELRWQGATPGKRLLGVRVIDAEGGPLTSSAILGRNIVRNVELLVPLMAIFASEQIAGASPGWVRLIATLWALALLFMPFFNRDRLRMGDLIAGTMVVLAPRARLLPDIGGESNEGKPDLRYRFTEKQLDVYGIYELQVLERVLRGSQNPEFFQTVARVQARIAKKIKWQGGPVEDPERFLREFYSALRSRLERRMLLGERKVDKFSSGKTIPPTAGKKKLDR